MSYELIITEKPSAAKKIAECLAEGKPIRELKNGVPVYNITHGSRDIKVACAVGHLYTVAEKDKGKWEYPVFSMEWVESSKATKSAAFTAKYVNRLKTVVKGADEFTIATDYDIEGEVIGYNVLRFICKQKDGNRMKFSTLTKPDLIESYKHKAHTIDWGQANAGITRHEMDWMYGINLSRALTLSLKHATGRFQLLSSGRVQGPALKILVEKEKEISKFKPTPYWQISLSAEAEKSEIEALHEEDKFWEKEQAEKVMEKVKGEKEAKVSKVERKQTKQAPPVPFDLTTLQTEAHKTLKYVPKRTLEIAQELYINGYISYPRTSSQKLPKAIGYDKILNSLKKNDNYREACTFLLKKSSLTPNEGKKTDDAHPAIYPTGMHPKSASEQGMKLYDLIVRRFLAVFGEAALRETMKISLDVKSEIFVASGTRTVEPGWHELYGKYVMLKEEELPAVKEGQVVKVKEINMLDKETTPPPRYTASSIIRELEKRNLGTKATRAHIIENLYSRGYVNERSIEATELGIKTCDVLAKYSPEILDEKLTRDFEEDMEDIRQGKKTPEQVKENVKKVLIKVLDRFKENEQKIGEELSKATMETRNIMSYIGKCPNCEGELHIRKGKFGNFIACNEYPDCKTTFSLPNVLVKPAQKNCEACGMPMVRVIRKRKRPEEVCIDPQCPAKQDKAKMEEAMEKAGERCPTCNEGKVVVRKSIYGVFLGCDRYPKCRYTQKVGEE